MKLAYHRKTARPVSGRTLKGQALLEGVAVLMLIIPIAIGLLLLLVNTYMAFSTQEKIKQVAQAAAQYTTGKKYWLGVTRIDYNQSAVHDQVRILVDALLSEVGLPAAASVEINEREIAPPGIEGVTTVSNVTIRVNGIKTIGGLFVPVFGLTATGTSLEQNLPPYAVGQIIHVDPTHPERSRLVMFPAYGAGRENGQFMPVGGIGKVLGPTTLLSSNLLSPPIEHEKTGFQDTCIIRPKTANGFMTGDYSERYPW
jgi:hypothetical protein